MLWVFMVLYTLGCIVFGPVFGQAESSRRGLAEAMLATAVWPLIVVVGALSELSHLRR